MLMNDEELKRQLDRIEEKANDAASREGGVGCLFMAIFLMFLSGCFKGCGY